MLSTAEHMHTQSNFKETPPGPFLRLIKQQPINLGDHHRFWSMEKLQSLHPSQSVTDRLQEPAQLFLSRGSPSVSCGIAQFTVSEVLNAFYSPAHPPCCVKGEDIMAATVNLGRKTIAMQHPDGIQCCQGTSSSHTWGHQVRAGLLTKQSHSSQPKC